MSELKIIENKFTIPLELAKPRFNVRRGWDETIARKLGNTTRMLEHPHPSRNAAADRWQEWHDARARTIYTLGRRASLLAMISFHEENLADENISHKMEFWTHQDPGRDFLIAFLQSAHRDFDQHETWLEIDNDDVSHTRLYDPIGYRQSRDNTMVRK